MKIENSKKFSYGMRGIGRKRPPLIVAEMSGNHNQSHDRALEIVQEAANAGVNALKLQTYTADTLTIKSNRKEGYANREDLFPQNPHHETPKFR